MVDQIGAVVIFFDDGWTCAGGCLDSFVWGCCSMFRVDRLVAALADAAGNPSIERAGAPSSGWSRYAYIWPGAPREARHTLCANVAARLIREKTLTKLNMPCSRRFQVRGVCSSSYGCGRRRIYCLQATEVKLDGSRPA